MAELFVARAETTDGLASYEAFSAINSATNQYIDHGAIMALFNDFDSDSVVRIKRVEVNEIVARTTTLPTKLTMQRLTALSGGDSVTPIKMDSNSASLPSQVSVVKNAGSITTTGAQYRDQLGYQNLSATVAMRHLAAPLFGASYSHLSGGKLNRGLIYSVHDANVQGIVLREGQGISLSTSSTAMQNYPLEISFHLSNGTDCYLVREVINASANPSLLAVLNGSGSGVVLTLGRIQVTQVKTDDILPMFTLETVSGIYDGADVTPIKMDTANTTVPSGVKIRKNCTVQQVNSDASVGGRKKTTGDNAVRRRAVAPFGVSAGLAAAWPLYNRRQAIFDFSSVADSDGGLVMREGQGIALLQRPNASAWGNYEVLIYFTNVYSPGSGVYPAVGDVDFGTNYGPSGTEYTGTLEQPAEADVLSGVQYGAGGAEFTGTATGGGGGNIFILNE